MRSHAIALCGVLACSDTLLAATVKKAGGESVDGSLEGLLVVRSQTTAQDGQKQLTFFLVNGGEVQVADAKKVSLARDGLLLQCMCLSDEMAPAAVLERVLAKPPAKGFKLTRPNGDDRLSIARHQESDVMNAWPFPGSGGSVFCIFGGAKTGDLEGALLGELRSAPGSQKVALSPFVSVKTSKGAITIPTSSLAQ